MSKIKVGIFGTGFGSLVSIPAVKSVKDFKLIGIYGRNKKKLNNISKKHQTSVFSKSNELFNKIEFAIIAMPPFLQYLFVKKAIALGTKKIIVFDKDISIYKTSEKIQFTKNLNFLLRSCDVISIHLPLNKFTKYLLNYKNLTHVKNNLILINTSRGGIVKDNDILKIIRIKNITYFLDVISEEPNYETKEKQKINKKFINNNNIFITPHLAAITENTQRNISNLLFKRIFNYFGIK